MNRRQGSGEFPMHPLDEPERPAIESEPRYRLVGRIAAEVWRSEPPARQTAARLESIAHAYAEQYAGMNLYHAHQAAILALYPHERASIGEGVTNMDPNLPNVETYEVEPGTFQPGRTWAVPSGWYWQPAEPGTGRGPFGPFETEAEALADARNGMEDA